MLTYDFSSLGVILISTILVLLFVKYHWSRRHLYLASAQLPGPWALPLIGNGFAFLRRKEDILQTLLAISEPYTSPFRIWLGPELVIFIKEPDQFQAILPTSKMSKKSYIYSFLEPFLGNGLFTSSGGLHKTHRKLLQPMFSPKYLEGYSQLFQKHANKFVDSIKDHLDGPEFDILLYLHDSAFEATMDIILEDKNQHPINYKEFPKYIKRFYDIFFKRIVSIWLHSDFIYKWTSYYKEQQFMSKIATLMIAEMRSTKLPEVMRRLETGIKSENEETRTPSVLEMMLEMMYENPDCFTEKEFVDHLITFVVTSQDTQGSVIAFTCMMLGVHSDIQERVVNELKQVLGDRKVVNYSDLTELRYLEMCIKESMRLFPLGPFLPRDVTEDFPLEKWILPKGSSIVFDTFSVHRHPKHWERPNEYYPEHFSNEAVAKRHPYAYVPFSSGPRRCIAQQYSYVNTKIIMATILLNYTLECDKTLEDIKLMIDVSVRPIDGYNLKIKKRAV